MNILIEYINQFVFLFNEMAVYLLLGLAVAGGLRVVFSDKIVSKYLSKPSFKSNILASGLGVPLPLCSCGVVPAAMSLNKQGASKGATISFLTSTPQTGVDSILVTYGFLGLPLAIYKLIIALVSGVVGGTIFDLLGTDNAKKEQDPTNLGQRIKGIRAYLRYSFFDLVISLRKWLILGIAIAAIISLFVPENFLEIIGIHDNKIMGYLLMLAISVPMYVCATASVPIAAALVAKGLPAGAAVIFLIGGPATNAATLTILWKVIGKKATLVYLFNIIFCSLFFAFLFDLLYPNYKSFIIEQTHIHSQNSIIQPIGSIVLLALIIYSYLDVFVQKKRLQQNKNPLENPEILSLKIKGISCQGCVMKIKNSLKKEPFVTEINLNTSGECHIVLNQTGKGDLIRQKIKDLGYDIK